MGTVLHLIGGDGRISGSTCFSPLLDGDGVASQKIGLLLAREKVSVPFSMGTVLHRKSSPSAQTGSGFQSPSRWGRCCISQSPEDTSTADCWFQSPSRWGRCCIRAACTHPPVGIIVSVPFSMGTVLHPCGHRGPGSQAVRFQSPSRWGRCCISGLNRFKQKG